MFWNKRKEAEAFTKPHPGMAELVKSHARPGQIEVHGLLGAVYGIWQYAPNDETYTVWEPKLGGFIVLHKDGVIRHHSDDKRRLNAKHSELVKSG